MKNTVNIKINSDWNTVLWFNCNARSNTQLPSNSWTMAACT